MKLSKTLLGSACLLAVGVMQPVAAQSGGQMSIVVPYPPGGGSDFVARTIAPVMARALNRNIIVENLSGAGGAVGSARVLQRPADGQTLLLGSPNEVILAPEVNPALDYQAEDFRLVGAATVTSQVLVARSSFEPQDAAAVLEHARKPETEAVTYGSVGIGSLYHVTGEVLASETNTKLLHVPYRGVAPLVQDLIGGQVDISFLPMAGSVLGLIRDNKIKAYGVAQTERNPLSPEIPTLGEIAPELKNFHYPTWAGLLVRAETPDDVVHALQNALSQALADPQVRKAIEDSGSAVAEPIDLTRAAAQYAADIQQFRGIVNDHSIAAH